jgi:hypothetical protein
VPAPIDSLAEHGRHRLVLHDRPHQLEVLPAGQLVSSADLFVRTHPKVGPLCVTTSHTLLNTFDDAEFAVDETLYVLVDTDLVSQLMLTFERGSPVRWRT